MPIIWILLINLILCEMRELYTIVNVSSRYFLLVNKIARPIQHPESIAALNFNINDLKNMSESSLSSYSIGEPIPLFTYMSKDPDDAVRLYILKSSIFNGKLLTNIVKVGDYINPSIGLFNGRLFLVSALQLGLSGIKKKYPNNNVEFQWLNNTRYPFYSNEPYLGIESDIEQLNIEIKGQDPRMIIHNDTFVQIFFTSVVEGLTHQKMGVAELKYLKNEKRINITYVIQPIIPTANMNRNQKNWSPFIYKDETYLIQSIQPFTVVRMNNYGGDWIKAEVISSVDSDFQYTIEVAPIGLRGGTNAVRLSDRYLSFYHARMNLPFDFMTTYVFGAYSFSTDPPFTLLSMSVTPIMPEELYTGQWEGRFIDYCLYPMYIALESEEFIHISFGYQDKWGTIGNIHLPSLLKTMVPINETYTFTSLDTIKRKRNLNHKGR